jgi:hypothetical protein
MSHEIMIPKTVAEAGYHLPNKLGGGKSTQKNELILY